VRRTPPSTGVAVFKNDFHTIRRFAERANNIVHWSVFDLGGHFAAMDAPDLLIGDLGSSSAHFGSEPGGRGRERKASGDSTFSPRSLQAEAKGTL
jgi:hypothetical protein